MDWRYALFTAEQGFLGIVPLIVAMFALLAAARPGRRIVACSPNLTALSAFAISCIVAGLRGVEHWPLVDYFPFLGLLLTIVLIAPSALSLRTRWLGLIHLLTLLGALLSWFVGAMAITHDWL